MPKMVHTKETHPAEGKSLRGSVSQVFLQQAGEYGETNEQTGRPSGVYVDTSAEVQATWLAGVSWQTVQRHNMANQIGATQGNHHLTHIVALRHSSGDPANVQRDDHAGRAPSGGEGATEERQPEVRIEVSEEEAREDMRGLSVEDIETNMSEELGIASSHEDVLYINMPELIAGMGYTADRMQGIFQPLTQGREQLVMPAYRAWRRNPEDPALRAAFDAAMLCFEGEVGRGVRHSVQQYWQAQTAGDPANATAVESACTEIAESLQSETDTLFPETDTLFPEEEDSPPTMSITEAENVRTRLLALVRRLDTELPDLVEAPFADRVAGGTSQRLRRALTRAGNTLKRTANRVQPTVQGPAVARLQSGMSEALLEVEAAAQGFRGVAAQMTEHNRRVGNMASRVMDVDAVPLLVPVTRATARVTFRGGTATFHTHHESRMAYYEEPYNQSGNLRQPRPLSEAPAAAEDRPAGAREGRMYDVYQALIRQAVPVSEAKILAAIAGGEGSFVSTQAIDRVRFSWGMIQFQGAALMAVLQRIRRTNAGLFAACFEAYGISLSRPASAEAGIRRTGRSVPGQRGGVPTREASGVESLFVYDHNTHQWTSGNEGLSVIQADPRYQMLFIAAAQEPDVQLAQMMQARDEFVLPVRAQTLTLGRGEAQRSLRVRDFVNNEVAMFGLVERKVATGNITFATEMFNRYLRAYNLTPESLTATPDQPRLAAWVRTQRREVRWSLADGLPAANLEALNNSTYTGGEGD